MSERIRAGDVLHEAFQFGARRWPAVLRYVWLPLILSGFATFGIAMLVLDVDGLQTAIETSDTGMVSIAPFLKVSPTMAIAAAIAAVFGLIFIYSGAYASIFRLTALGEDRPGVAQLRFDGPAQRVFFAQLILMAINLALWGAAFMIALSVSGVSFADIGKAMGDLMALAERAAADPAFKPSPAEAEAVGKPLGALFLGGVFAALPMAYVNVKLAPFLAGSAAENRILLFGSFRMTRGHAWSIFGTYVLFMIAMFILMMVFGLAMGLFELLGQLSGGGGLSIVGKLFTAIGVVLDAAFQVYVLGVSLAMQGIIYRRLATGE